MCLLFLSGHGAIVAQYNMINFQNFTYSVRFPISANDSLHMAYSNSLLMSGYREGVAKLKALIDDNKKTQIVERDLNGMQPIENYSLWQKRLPITFEHLIGPAPPSENENLSYLNVDSIFTGYTAFTLTCKTTDPDTEGLYKMEFIIKISDIKTAIDNVWHTNPTEVTLPDTCLVQALVSPTKKATPLRLSIFLKYLKSVRFIALYQPKVPEVKAVGNKLGTAEVPSVCSIDSVYLRCALQTKANMEADTLAFDYEKYVEVKFPDTTSIIWSSCRGGLPYSRRN
jgi:hypothetical protein